jgi:hypothetical protein
MSWSKPPSTRHADSACCLKGGSRRRRRKMKTIVQLNLKFRTSRNKLVKHWTEHAPTFAPNGEIKGLLWKIWLMNEAEKSAGGIYLFRDKASAKAYVNGPIIAACRTCDLCSAYDIRIKVWDILPGPTKITRGPVD